MNVIVLAEGRGHVALDQRPGSPLASEAPTGSPAPRCTVDINVNSVDAGNGVYGQMDRHVDFKIGNSVVMKANLQTDQMAVMVNGKLARTIPITGGKPGFETRSGTKLIVEKFAEKRMDAATVGISPATRSTTTSRMSSMPSA